jgi:alpha-ketoglutarate-dependent taurine dioxygenase
MLSNSTSRLGEPSVFDFRPLPEGVSMESGWPPIIRPAASGPQTPDEVLAWYDASRPALDTLLTQNGAVLLRGFAIPDMGAFGRMAALHPAHRLRYVAGTSPRAHLAGNVYESTRVDEHYKIALHQEKSYISAFPRMLAFYCEQPASEGGETTICDMREVSQRLPAETKKRFAARGVHFKRNFRDGDRRDEMIENSALREYHRVWQEAFDCETQEEVAEHCRQLGLEHQWLNDGSVTVSNTRPALICHPLSGEEIWFNQAATLHPNSHSLGSAYPIITHFYRDRPAPPYEVSYGDGGSMSVEDLVPIYGVMGEFERAVRWQRGDYLLLDNILVAHGRNPYSGPRAIRVAMFD